MWWESALVKQLRIENERLSAELAGWKEQNGRLLERLLGPGHSVKPSRVEPRDLPPFKAPLKDQGEMIDIFEDIEEHEDDRNAKYDTFQS